MRGDFYLDNNYGTINERIVIISCKKKTTLILQFLVTIRVEISNITYQSACMSKEDSAD